mgnify:FL=1
MKNAKFVVLGRESISIYIFSEKKMKIECEGEQLKMKK